MVVIGVVLAFFRRVVFEGGVFFFRDFGLYFYPRRAFAAEAVRSLSIPLWESLSGGGQVFLAAYQNALFYPPALIYYLLPMPWSFTFFVVLHFALTGCGMYLLLRLWKLRRTSSLAGALLWTLSPPLVSVLDNVGFLTSIAWLPWCTLFAALLLRRRKYRDFAWLSVAFALAILAGAPEPVLFISLVLAVLAASHIWRLRGAGRKALRGLAAILAALAVGALMAGAALVPLVEHLPASKRASGVGAEEAAAWSLPPGNLVNTVLPARGLERGADGISWPGQSWLKSVYLGVVVLALAIAALLVGRRGPRTALAFAAVCFIVLSVGQYTPVWRLLHNRVPAFSLVRYPVKFFVPATFLVVCLGAIGIDRISGMLGRAFRESAWARVVRCMAAAALATVAAGDFAWRSKDLSPTGGPRLYDPPASATRLEQAGASRFLIAPALKVYADGIKIGRLDGMAGLSDCLAAFKGDDYRALPTVMRWVRESAGERGATIDEVDRVLRSGDGVEIKRAALFEFYKEVLYPDMHMLYGLAGVDAGEVLQTKWSWNLRQALLRMGDDRAMERLFAVDWVVQRGGEGMELAAGRAEQTAMSVMFVRRIEEVPNDEAALAAVSAQSFDPRLSVVLSASDADRVRKAVTPGGIVLDMVRCVENTGNRQVFDVKCSKAALLYTADNFHPAITARVDGVEAPVYRANYAFRAVVVPAGTHRVEFAFSADSLARGLAASGAGIAVLVVLAFVSRRLTARGSRRASPDR